MVIAMERENILSLNRVLKELGYVPRLPVNPDDLADENIRQNWIEDRNKKAFSYHHQVHIFQVADIVLSYHTGYEHLKRNISILNARGMSISIISIDDLIEMKRHS